MGKVRLLILLDSETNQARADFACKDATQAELSFVNTQLDTLKLKIISEFAKLNNKNQNI